MIATIPLTLALSLMERGLLISRCSGLERIKLINEYLKVASLFLCFAMVCIGVYKLLKTWQPEPCGTFTVKLVGNGDKMLYPAYIHAGDDQHAHGVTIPDFPGCFSAADEWEDLPHMIQEAAEVYFEGEDIPVPAPTSLEQLTANPEYQGGVWLLVDIDLAKLKVKAKRVNITMSENLLQEIDRYAMQYHMTRSGLLAQAAEQYIHRKQTA